jgi:hypothetical protein
MQETEETMMQSRRSKRERVAERRSLSSSSLMVASFSMNKVAGGDVGFGLVVVVVGDEVLDGVGGEEGFELVIELGGEGLVVREDEGGALDLLDNFGHGEGFAGAGDAEQDLVFVAGAEAGDELGDGAGLVALGFVGGGELKVHRLSRIAWGGEEEAKNELR